MAKSVWFNSSENDLVIQDDNIQHAVHIPRISRIEALEMAVFGELPGSNSAVAPKKKDADFKKELGKRKPSQETGNLKKDVDNFELE